MSSSVMPPPTAGVELRKCPTGIEGFDLIARGGLPSGRPTLLVGHAGSGKTLFALEFVLNGAAKHGEPGVFASFEESPADLLLNLGGLEFDARALVDARLVRLMHVEIDPEEMVEAGDYDLDGLFLQLNAAIEQVGARRLVLDAVENLFAGFTDSRRLRHAFRKLLGWFKDRGITTVVTTERGAHTLTRHGLEEYVADCVVALDNRVEDELATRRIRIVKYRGSAHEVDEFPFLLDRTGVTVMPTTAAGMQHVVSNEIVSTGIPDLDAMLPGGVYRGSSMLVSGTSGTGKSSIAAHAADAACRRGERCLYVALEESPDQIERNMKSIGVDLTRWRQAGQLRFLAARATEKGLEAHLARLIENITSFAPGLVVVDPVTAYGVGLDTPHPRRMLVRLTDLLKCSGTTSVLTALTAGGAAVESTSAAISSLVDVWLLLRNIEQAGERTRGLYVCKARGLSHSNQIREFVLSDEGVKLVEVMLDDAGSVLTGSARDMHLRALNDESQRRLAEATRRREMLANRARVVDARVAAMRAESEDELRALEAELLVDVERADRSGRTLKDLAMQRSLAGRGGQ